MPRIRTLFVIPYKSYLVLGPKAGEEKSLLVALNKIEKRSVRGTKPWEVHQHDSCVVRKNVDGFGRHSNGWRKRHTEVLEGQGSPKEDVRVLQKVMAEQ